MTAPLRSAVIAALLTSLVPALAIAEGLEKEETARVRVIHASPDTPAVDVLVNDLLVAFSSVQFKDVTEYAEVPANVYDIKVVPAGAGPDAAAVQADLNLFYETDYTVVALNTFDNVKAMVLVDDNEAPKKTQARIRFVHAAADAPAVDIKVENGPFMFQNVSFEGLGDYVTVPTRDYTLEVRVAGTDTVVLRVPGVELDGGGVYTLLAAGLVEDGSLGAMIAADSRQGGDAFIPLPVERPRPFVGFEGSQNLAPAGSRR